MQAHLEVRGYSRQEVTITSSWVSLTIKPASVKSQINSFALLQTTLHNYMRIPNQIMETHDHCKSYAQTLIHHYQYSCLLFVFPTIFQSLTILTGMQLTNFVLPILIMHGHRCLCMHVHTLHLSLSLSHTHTHTSCRQVERGAE